MRRIYSIRAATLIAASSMVQVCYYGDHEQLLRAFGVVLSFLGAIAPGYEATLHYAMDRPKELMLVCAGSPVGALSMVLPGFGSSKTAGRSPTILIE